MTSSRLTGELVSLSLFLFVRYFFHFLVVRDGFVSLLLGGRARNGGICILWKSGWSSFFSESRERNDEFLKSYHTNSQPPESLRNRDV